VTPAAVSEGMDLFEMPVHIAWMMVTDGNFGRAQHTRTLTPCDRGQGGSQ
jgi:hypothetical protein